MLCNCCRCCSYGDYGIDSATDGKYLYMLLRNNGEDEDEDEDEMEMELTAAVSFTRAMSCSIAPPQLLRFASDARTYSYEQ